MSDQSLPEALLSGVRFGQFVSVGVVGAVFDTIVLTLVRLGLGAPEMVAKAAGIETAILVMFFINENWTFAEQGRSGRRPLLGRLVRSHVVRSGGVTVQLVAFWVLTEQVPVSVVVYGTDLWFLLASPLAIGTAMFVNYIAESMFTWGIHR